MAQHLVNGIKENQNKVMWSKAKNQSHVLYASEHSPEVPPSKSPGKTHFSKIGIICYEEETDWRTVLSSTNDKQLCQEMNKVNVC